MPPADQTSRLRALRRFALVAIVANVVIVVSGGLVRVTGSGLGCPTWPTCDGTNLVPLPGGDHAGWQTAVEFGNRLLSLVVLASVVAVFVQVRRTRPHHPTVERLAWLLPVGVLVQAVMGGITVLTGLSPLTVAGHFLLSMVLIAGAVALHERLRPDGHPRASASLLRLTTAIALVGAVVLVLGTIVTGAGPHGGDLDAPRLAIDIRTVARLHAGAVWVTVALTVALVVATARRGPPRLRTAARALLAAELLQGAIGYTQYALGIPEPLVVLHILGAALFWTAASASWIRARPVPPTPDAPAPITAHPATDERH